MSIIQMDLPDARVLDLFAGTGALGIEALSRGAQSTDFVESSTKSLKVLDANLKAFEIGSEGLVHRSDALKFIANLPAHAYDIAFADPPYASGFADVVAEQWLKVPFARILGIEHERNVRPPGDGDRRVYGDSVVTFYRTP